jgi:hypothetical protein
MFSVTIPAKRDRNLPGTVARSIVTGPARPIRHVVIHAHVAGMTGIAAFRQKGMGRGEFARHVRRMISCQRIRPQPRHSRGDTKGGKNYPPSAQRRRKFQIAPVNAERERFGRFVPQSSSCRIFDNLYILAVESRTVKAMSRMEVTNSTVS